MTDQHGKTTQELFVELQITWHQLFIEVGRRLYLDVVCECLEYIIGIVTATGNTPRDDE